MDASHNEQAAVQPVQAAAQPAKALSKNPTKEEWANMTGPERQALQAARRAEALELIDKTGGATGLAVTIAGQRVIARPTGVSAGGNVTYGIPRGTELTVQAGDEVKRLRINTGLSITIMPPVDGVAFDGDEDRLL